MSDPVEITQQATQTMTDSGPATHASWAILGGVVLKVVEAIAKLFGSPKDRAEAKRDEADATTVIVDAAKDVIEAQREDTQRVRAERDATANERDDCQAQLREVRRAQAADRRRIAALEEETQACARNSEWMERVLIAVVAGEPIPPKPDPTPRKETHGKR